LDKKKVQISDEKPEMFSSPKISSKLPPKMRCIQKPSMNTLHHTSSKTSMNSQPPQQYDQYYRNLQMYGDHYHRSNPFTHSSLPDIALNNADAASQFFNYHQHQQQYNKFPSNPFSENHDKQSFYDRNLNINISNNNNNNIK
jgi:hypothetical protein